MADFEFIRYTLFLFPFFFSKDLGLGFKQLELFKSVGWLLITLLLLFFI